MRNEMLFIVLFACGMAGCASTSCEKPGRYLDARPGATLEIPEGLDEPPTTRTVSVPDAPNSVHPELRGGRVVGPDGQVRCLIDPPPLTGERSRNRG